MHTDLIQRQYDDVIAPHYDLDPQSIIGNSLDRAVAQLREQQQIAADPTALRVLDLGIGTGRFLAKLAAELNRPLQPAGLDLSEKMIAVARARVPDLVAVVDDATNVETHFPPESIDVIGTHFITGFVPVGVLAPKIWTRLAEGGYWSFVGGMQAGFPAMRRKAESTLVRRLFGARGRFDVGDFLCNPADRVELVGVLEANGFSVRKAETFLPQFRFANLEEFLEICYRGGWLTPFIEAWKVHKVGPFVRLLLNTFIFPMRDHHVIEIVLAQKTGSRPPSPS
jgi:SAM-dependent methyltransferase